MLRIAEDRSFNHTAAETDAASAAILSRLRGVVLLAGSVRPSPLRRAAGRMLLELPIDAERSVMDLWHQHLTHTAEVFGLDRVPVRVIVDRTTALPTQNEWNGRCDVRFEQDPLDFRGTGGLLRDLATQYDPDDYLLIANGTQLLLDPLVDITRCLADLHADVALACRGDHSPTGIMLVRCGCLLSIPDVGFVDLNEQALPAIAKQHDVRATRGSQMGGIPMRTLNEYLDALRLYHRFTRDKSGAFPDPFAEDWRATFAIIEPGADVAPSAVVHDSIVLAGGRVEAGGLAVRSLICPGGIVTQEASAIDCLVGGSIPSHGR